MVASTRSDVSEGTCLLQTERGKRLQARTSLKPDRNVLQWRVSGPKAGDTIDGTLKVSMDPSDPDSPDLVLQVQMILAETQPAPNGPILVHCGGPSSGASCGARVAKSSPGHYKGYDVWSITQRGMQGNNLTLLCDSNTDSMLPETCGLGGCKVSDFTTCDCALPDGTPQIGEIWADVDPRKESDVRTMFEKMSDWGMKTAKCYTSEKWQIEGKCGKKWNFLDYVGTQYLAQDIDVFRKAIGADKMSVYGYSYGTYVGAVYATVFPENIHRIVLDGNMSPWPQKNQQALGDAEANDKAIAKLLLDCRADPARCSLSNAEEEYMAVVEMAHQGKLTARTKSGAVFPLTVGMLMAYLQMKYTSNTGLGFPQCTQTLAKLSPNNTNQTARSETVGMILDGFCVVKGVPTWYDYDVCVGPGQTMAQEGQALGDTYFEQCAIWGVDQAGLYRVEDALGRWRANKEKFGDAGVAALIGDIAGYSFWPATATPNAPMVRASVPVLVVGNLFDTATGYTWSQQMRQAFSKGALLTWQGVGHTMPRAGNPNNYDPVAIEKCQALVREYMQNGTLPQDGHTCHSTKPVPVGL
uniref:AB hydrolase-1 domain-containing protein n=1 Tax=Zooxanthella nutricula TaxID=1333877 RepID=A0A7S2KKI6_9DINO